MLDRPLFSCSCLFICFFLFFFFFFFVCLFLLFLFLLLLLLLFIYCFNHSGNLVLCLLILNAPPPIFKANVVSNYCTQRCV